MTLHELRDAIAFAIAIGGMGLCLFVGEAMTGGILQ